jgi:DegV family protein with EDD domain
VELSAENTAIVLDSTADFPDAPQRFPNWRVVPLYVRFGADSYRDYVDIGPAEFYERLRTAEELPTTSQPTPQDFQAAYEELAGYERILALTVSAKLSGTYESALRAGEESGGRVRVIDSETASAAIAMLALAVQRRLERGTTDEEVDELVERFKRESGLIFTLDTLEYLARGGRIGRAAGWAGQLLHIKPILTLEDGEVLPVKRVRGNRKAIQEFSEAFRAATRDQPGLRVGIAHAEAPERMAALEKLVRDVRPNAEIEVATTLGPVVGTHAGPGTVGLFWLQDRAQEA